MLITLETKMPEESAPKNSKFSAYKKVNYKYISIALLVVILLLVVLWRPWVKAIAADSRTIQVTGTASVKSTPDEYVFYPSYTSKNTDTQAAIAELSKKSEEIVAKLKSLGVTDESIKTNSSTVDGKYMLTTMYPAPDATGSTLQITVTVNSREQAQKVQDYLVTTSPTYAVSPTPGFSAAKQKQLQSQARDEAAKDAKAQAQQMAKNLGFKLGAVKTVEDQSILMGRGGIMPMAATTTSSGTLEAGTITVDSMALPASGAVAVGGGAGTALDITKASQLTVMPGQDEVTYGVTVTYFVK